METGPDKTKMMTNNPNGFQRVIKLKCRITTRVFFSGLPRKQQLFRNWRSYGKTRTSCLFLRLSWCGRSSYPHFFMPVRAGPWQQNLKKGSKPLKWDAIADFYFLDRPCDERWRSQHYHDATGVHDDLLSMVKKLKLRWYGHISRSSGMTKTIL